MGAGATQPRRSRRGGRGGAGGGGARRARGDRRDFAKGLFEGTFRRDFAKGLSKGFNIYIYNKTWFQYQFNRVKGSYRFAEILRSIDARRRC